MKQEAIILYIEPATTLFPVVKIIEKDETSFSRENVSIYDNGLGFVYIRRTID